MKSQIRQFALLSLLLCCSSFGHADTHTWNDDGGGTWGTFIKWTPTGLPSANDTARFDLNLDYTVSLLQSRQVRLLQVLGGDVVLESSGIFPGDRNLVLDDAFISNLGELVIKRGSNDRALKLSTSDDMTVRGNMTVANGAELDNRPVVVDGGQSSSTGQLTIEGVGPSGTRSIWSATELYVGNLERGVVRVEDRGFAQINGPAILGDGAGGDGEVVVTGRSSGGTTSDFRTTGPLTIGRAGAGTFRVEDGGNAATSGVIFGDVVGGRGTATIGNDSVGNPSSWIAGQLNIRRGDLTVNRSGFLRSTAATIGSEAPSSVTVSGAGTNGNLGRWIANGLTKISSSHNATLDIEQGGLVEAEEASVGLLAGGVGRINVSSSNPAIESRWRQTGDLYLGGDSLGQGGVGHLNLNTNSYARIDGTTTIYANSSIVMGPNSQLIAPTIDNSHGGFFDFLRGTLNTRNFTGDLVNQEGTLAPYTLIFLDGSGTGLTTIDGDYTQQAGATLAIDINGELCGIGYDHVRVNGDTTLGGDLQLTLLDDFLPQPNDTFDVLAAEDLQGIFDNVNPGERLTTTDGSGSFVVNYGATSPFNVDQVILSDFQAAVGYPGDFDGDESVEGIDFQLWQRNDASVSGLAAWQANYGTSAPAVAATTAAIPEPATLALLILHSISAVATIPGRRVPGDA